MNPAFAAQLQTLYLSEGMTIAELAKHLSVCSETARRWLVEAGIPRRPRGAPAGKHLPAGGRTTDKDGYELTRVEDHPFARGGYVLTHRLVIEQELGRYLQPEEVVGRINGDKSDNRPDNLKLYPSDSELKKDSLRGNARAKGDTGNPKRRVRRNRSGGQILFELARLQATLGRDIRRDDLRPPAPSYRSVSRLFGTWQMGVAAALKHFGPNGLSAGDWSAAESLPMTPRRDAA